MDEPRAARYRTLHRDGTLARRAEQLRRRLRACDLCPRRCAVDRTAGELGTCGIGDRAVVASAGPHFGEEAPLVGRHGSGTVFFSGCSLRCSFCQNADISMTAAGRGLDDRGLADVMLRLQELGCPNVNLVTPTHVVPMIVAALDVAAADGLHVPLVYNTGGYDGPEVIRELDGIVDLYMPDTKFADPEPARRYCDAPDYPVVVREVLREMFRQVGDLQTDAAGVATRGLLVRHLVLPGDLAGTAELMEFVARELSTETTVNVMDQYRPCHDAGRFSELSRRPTAEELAEARLAARHAGLTRFLD